MPVQVVKQVRQERVAPRSGEGLMECDVESFERADVGGGDVHRLGKCLVGPFDAADLTPGTAGGLLRGELVEGAPDAEKPNRGKRRGSVRWLQE